MTNVLIVEDEQAIRRFLRTALEADGLRVYEAETLQRGLLEAATRKPDLNILDLGLPDGDGIDFIRDLRQWSAIPVIVLSARSEESDKIAALDAGADDYLSKPFGIGELQARLRVALRRHASGASPEPVVHFSNVKVDIAARLGGDEFCVLACLEDPDDLERMAEYLVSTASALWEMHGEPPLICRLSIGGCLIDPERDWQSWYASADAALYRVKGRGGNGFEVAAMDDETLPPGIGRVQAEAAT